MHRFHRWLLLGGLAGAVMAVGLVHPAGNSQWVWKPRREASSRRDDEGVLPGVRRGGATKKWPADGLPRRAGRLWAAPASLDRARTPEGTHPSSLLVSLQNHLSKPAGNSLPGVRAPIRLTLSLGTQLRGEPSDGWWKLRLLDGSTGWIRAEEVAPLGEPPLRSKLVQTARLFLGSPYYWGGRSARAVDCSGLVSLVYQANGIKIPRDAHEQWMRAKPISREALLPGDLVFLHDPEHPNQITHVMLYSEEARAIEGPGTGKKVREIDLQTRLKENPRRQVSFGSYIS